VLFIGLGCGALLLIGGAGTLWFFYSASKVATTGLAVASAFAAAADGGALSVPLAAPGAAASGAPVTAPNGGLATGGPVCEQAAACCKAIVGKTAASPQALSGCEGMLKAPQIGCTQALETYRRTAPLVGASCP
jgi:hypothetical protein